MTLKRRDFLKTMGAGAMAASVPLPLLNSQAEEPKLKQQLHRDYVTTEPGVEYYVLGNGLIQAVVESSPADEGTHCGLLVMSPEHFGRKASTFLYHPERGLERTLLTLSVDRKGYQPRPGQAKLSWTYPDSIPTVSIEWQAGSCLVREELFCPVGVAALVRSVTVKNTGEKEVPVSASALLSPNFMFFDEFEVQREKKTLTAVGYHRLQLFSPQATAVGDRNIEVGLGPVAPGGERTFTMVMTLDYPREEYEKIDGTKLRASTAAYWARLSTIDTPHQGLNHLYHASVSGIRGAIAHSGKMDGGIWQYNQEWVRDQSMVATAAAMNGMTDVAAAILERILTRSVDEEGKTVESSRTRPLETFEIDQNGELLYALWMYWVWSGSDDLIKKYWSRIRLVAEFILNPAFVHPPTGLLKNTREYWERDASMGVREGFELTYQLWNIVGLDLAAALARHMGEGGRAARWQQAAARMRDSFLKDPKYSLVSDGHFIKRRLATGEVQKTFEPVNRQAMPPGSPLRTETVSRCDPDSANVLPIALEMIDPRSPLALNTLRFVEPLWNQRWTGGGYGRYDASSEPDSAGSWPFASMFIIRAYLEAGDYEKVWRGLDWMNRAPGGQAGAWFEFNGDRMVPPLPPVGIVPWVWAELSMFFVHHLLGIRPAVDHLVIRPVLLTGVDSLNASVALRGSRFTLHVTKSKNTPRAVVNGSPVPVENGRIDIPFPPPNTTIEMAL